MTSSSKSDSVFATNKMGGTPGKSPGMVRKSIPGGTLLSAYPQDNIHGVDLPGTMAGANKFAGGDSFLGHSLSGASAVVDQYPRDGANPEKEI
jgi:hypothetical protein